MDDDSSPDDEGRQRDERKRRPSPLEYALIIAVMALIALMALGVYGLQTRVILSTVSGSV
jgi:hypothetical protein